MISETSAARLLKPAMAPILALALAGAVSGCMGFGSGSEPQADAVASTATGEAKAQEPLDVRRFIGPDYCPEVRIREGTEVARRYEAGHENEAAGVIWQASIGKTARECLYDQGGNLTLRVGVSGRVVPGPKGGAQNVVLPLRIAVAKYREAVLASQLYPVSVVLPAASAGVFTQVHELTVPSPGAQRDYIIYIGFDESGEGVAAAAQIPGAKKPEAKPKPVAKVAKPKPKKPVVPPPPVKAAPAPSTPRVLPVPAGGFVLPGG